MSDRSDSFCRGQLSRTGSAASRAGCFVVTVALLFGLSARAEPKKDLGRRSDSLASGVALCRVFNRAV